MDAKLTELLKVVEEAEEHLWSADESYLTRIKKIDSSTINKAKSFDLLWWTGANYILTEKGHARLDNGRSLELLEKIHRSVNTEKIGVIFDANIFDKIVDGELSIQEIELSQFKGYDYFIAHIQVDEVSKTPDADRRTRLMSAITKLKPTMIATESFVLGTSRLGGAKMGDGTELEKIRTPQNHTNDGLIGEIALKQNLILVTQDDRLRTKVIQRGGKAITLNEFKEMIK